MLSIKQANKADLTNIATMDKRVADNSGVKNIQLADSTQAWLSWIENGVVFKACDETCDETCDENNALTGLIVTPPIKGRGYFIHKLLISEYYHNSHVAQRLISHFLRKIDKHEEKASVIIKPDDIHAISMYLSMGFSEQTFHSDYLGENEDRLILSRPIQWSDSDNRIVSPHLHQSSQKEAKQKDDLLFIKSMDLDNYLVS